VALAVGGRVLTLDENYVVDVDRYCYHLKKWKAPDPQHHKTTEEAKPRLVHVGYYGTLGGVLKRYVKEEVRKFAQAGRPLDELVDFLEVLYEKVEEIGDRLHYEFKEAAKHLAQQKPSEAPPPDKASNPPQT
jgi:hypothetical protein